MPETGIKVRSTYNNVNDYLHFTGNEKTPTGVIMREIVTRQSFSSLLPVKICSGGKNGEKYEDWGIFKEPYQYDKASKLMSGIDGGYFDANYTSYERSDYMAIRGGGAKIYKYELRSRPEEVRRWRTERMQQRIFDTALDIETDMIYGNKTLDPKQCSGLMPRFNMLTDRHGKILAGANQGKINRYVTIDAGGTGDELASILLMSPNSSYGVVRLAPAEGTDYTASVHLQMGERDLNKEWNYEKVTSSDDAAYNDAFMREFTMDRFDVCYGIALLTGHACVRIANIDISTTSLANLKKIRQAYRTAYAAMDERLKGGRILAVMNTDVQLALSAFIDEIIVENQDTAAGAQAIPMAADVRLPKSVVVPCDRLTVGETQVT